jgi:hypothetical protein
MLQFSGTIGYLNQPDLSEPSFCCQARLTPALLQAHLRSTAKNARLKLGMLLEGPQYSIERT